LLLKKLEENKKALRVKDEQKRTISEPLKRLRKVIQDQRHRAEAIKKAQSADVAEI